MDKLSTFWEFISQQAKVWAAVEELPVITLLLVSALALKCVIMDSITDWQLRKLKKRLAPLERKDKDDFCS